MDTKVIQLGEGGDEIQFLFNGWRSICDQLETRPKTKKAAEVSHLNTHRKKVLQNCNTNGPVCVFVKESKLLLFIKVRTEDC